MSTREIAVRVRFETGHRLPQLAGKCFNLHGHSWQAWISAVGDLNADTVLVDFSRLKGEIQAWVDEHLDHGMMLGASDELVDLLAARGVKVYTFGRDRFTHGLPWPTVEAVAELLTRLTESVITELALPLRSVRVVVQETENNQAEVTR